MALNLRREEEENIFRKRLLYDGHGAGEDKRLVSLIKNVTRLFIADDSGDDLVKLANSINKDIAAGLHAAEKHERITQMCDTTFEGLQEAIECKKKCMLDVKSELASLAFELEFVEKLKRVNAYADCQTTESSMREIDRQRKYLVDKIERQRISLNILVSACKSLKRILDDDLIEDDGHEQMVVSTS